MSAVIIPFRQRVTTDEHFGGCPECGKCTLILNIRSSHVALCELHKNAWWIGSNLFSGWRDETEETWAQNEVKLANYREVRPVYPPPSSPPIVEVSSARDGTWSVAIAPCPDDLLKPVAEFWDEFSAQNYADMLARKYDCVVLHAVGEVA